MRKQIAQLFHNIIGKEVTQEFQSVQETRTQESSDTECLDRDVPVSPLDQKVFTTNIDRILAGDGAQGCLLIADVDRFREVNDLYGRDVGDAVLQSVAGTLRDVFGGNICLGKMGGDVFALWVPGLRPDHAGYIRRQVGVVNDRLLHAKGNLPPVSLSAGSAFSEAGDDCRSLGKKANKMLYRVKEGGRCGCEIFDCYLKGN